MNRFGIAVLASSFFLPGAVSVAEADRESLLGIPSLRLDMTRLRLDVPRGYELQPDPVDQLVLEEPGELESPSRPPSPPPGYVWINDGSVAPAPVVELRRLEEVGR